MTALLTSYQLSMYLSGTWTDMTSYVIEGPITCEWGISGNSPFDRLAGTGSMQFVLNNTGGLFTPGGDSALAGFKLGVFVGLVLTYDGQTYKRFFGKINDIQIEAGSHGVRRTFVTVLDWMDYAAKYPLQTLAIDTDKTADVALTTLVGLMPIAPQSRTFDTGTVTFPALFDTAGVNSVAYSEFAKLALSEWGYIYLKRDKDTGERLVFESSYHRNGLHPLTPVPLATSESSALLMETEDVLLMETGDAILFDELTTFTTDNTMSEMVVTYGGDIINRAVVTAYPKKVDTVAKVLYSLSSPMMIGSKQTITFKAGYTGDPAEGAAGAKVNAISSTMISPTATTDYTMYTTPATGGSDLTANLTVTAAYGTESVIYTLTNGSTSVGYIRKLQARGYGIYAFNPIESVQESSASYTEYGFQSQNIDQKCNRDLIYGELAAKQILDDYKQPRPRVQSITFSANRSAAQMMAFLNLDVGDLIHVIEDQTNTNGYYYIQSVSFSIDNGGLIMATYLLKLWLVFDLGLSLVGLEFANGTTDSAKFGYLPQLINQDYRSVSAWIYPTSEVSDVRIIAGAYSASGGWFLYTTGQHVAFYQEAPTTAGAWGTTNHVLTDLDTWYNVVLTRDCTVHDNLPKIYIDGVEVAVEEILHPGGDYNDETGAQFAIGNLDTAAHPLDYPFDGIIADVRYYGGRILTADEALRINNSWAHDASTGLLFRGPAVRTSEAASLYIDQTLTTETKLIDGIYGAIGTITGAPIGRENNHPTAPPEP